MARVTVYTTTYCPYCTMAKRLLEQRGVAYEEIILESSEQREEISNRSGMYTVPQIFLDKENLIGGFDQLAALDREKGGLDSLK